MKILVFIQNLAGGGAQRAIINIMNHLDKARFDIVLVYGDKLTNDYSNYIDRNITRISFQSKSKRLRHSFFKLREIVAREKPDLILSTIAGSNVLAALVNATLWRRAALVVRETNYKTASKHISKYSKFMTWMAYSKLSDAVIAISESVKEDLIQNFHISNRKIRSIHNLVDIDLINRLKEEKIEDLPMDDGVKKIIAVGRLVEQKDYPTLFRAFQIVASKCKARLTILGQGPLEPELKKLSVDLGIEDLVEFKGFATNPYKYMYHADVVVLTSKWEGFPNIVAETLACGVPLVATDCRGGTREILKDGLCGRLTPIGDHNRIAEEIIDVLHSDNNKIVSEGLKRVRDFSADKMVSTYEDLFLELYNKRDKHKLFFKQF